VALAPDVIFTAGSAGIGPLQRVTHTVPIVFAIVADPVGAGFVDSLARPGGNATGFILFDYGIGAKWLEVLKEIAPNTTRAAVLRDPNITAGIGQWGAIQSVSPSFAIEVSPINLIDPIEIDRAITAFAHSPNGGLIVTGSALTVVRRDLIITLAARYRLPAVYYDRYFVAAGGLISYGSNNVQAPTKYELIINLKTAKALGLTIPEKLLATADEVIE
jgi:putative tryptophan/tyrosine transport system substrate-binding protein